MSSNASTDDTPESATQIHHSPLDSSRILEILQSAAQVAAGSLTKKLFFAGYQASDEAYWQRHAAQFEWRSLGGIIEYTTDLLAVPGKRAAAVHLIAIRATPDAELRRVIIKVKAKKSGIIHQQKITLNKLSSFPVRKALTAIPFKPKSLESGEWHRLGNIYIKLVEAVDYNGVDLAKGKKIADIFPSTGTDALPDSHIERWGQYWNIDEINAEKENIKTRCYRELVQSARKRGRRLTFRKAAYRLLTSRLGMFLTFWSQNLWNAEGIRIAIARGNESVVVDDR